MEEHADTKRLNASLRERLIASGAIKPSADEQIKLAEIASETKIEEIADDQETYFAGFGDDALPAPTPIIEVATGDVWHPAFRVRKSQHQPWLRKFVVYDVEIGDPILDNECWTFFIKDEELDENGYLTQFTVDFQKKIDDVLRTTYCTPTNGVRKILSEEMPKHHESVSHKADTLVMKLSSLFNATMPPIEKAIFTKKVVEAPKATTPAPLPLPVLPKAAKTLVEAPKAKTAVPPPVPSATPPRPRRYSTKITDALPSVIIAPPIITSNVIAPNVETPAVKTVVDPFDNSAIVDEKDTKNVQEEVFQRVELPASQPRKTEPLNTTERMKSLLATLNEKPAEQDHASWQLVAAVLVLGLIAISLLGLGVKRAFPSEHNATNAVTAQPAPVVTNRCIAMSDARLSQYFGQKDPKHYTEQTTDGSDPNRPYIKLGALGTGFTINDDDTLDVSKSKICWR